MLNSSTVSSLYVSQAYGSDQWNGFYPDKREDFSGPLASIEEALARVRDMRRFGAKQPVSIRIIDTEYFIAQPIVIDGGLSDVTILPYTSCAIIGGVKLTGFAKDYFNGAPCVSKDVSALLDNGLWFTDLYFDGGRAQFTRFPETGTLSPERVENESTQLKAGSKWFIAKRDDFANIMKFSNLRDAMVSYNHYWVDEHSPIEDFEEETGKITFQYPSTYTIELTHPASALRYYIENVPEMFGAPNQWYLDRETKKVYYIPGSDEKITAYLPLANNIFIISGTADQKISGITIRNFTLRCTRGDKICEKMEYASVGQSVNNGFGVIEAAYTDHFTIENCKICNFGVHAIVLKNGCSNTLIQDNVISDGGAGGITVNGGAYGSPVAEHTYGCRIENNVIAHCGRRYLCGCGILIMHAYDSTIARNTIFDLYYSGISCGWVWGYGDSICRGNRIVQNHIYNIGQRKLSDMGGIYLLGKQQGTIVSGNRIHDVESLHYGGWGIYTDEGSSYITIEKNICYSVSCNCFHQHFGSMNTVRNNIFALAAEEPVKMCKVELHTGAIFEHNLLITDARPVYRLGYREEEAGAVYLMAANNNIVCDLSGAPATVLCINGRNYTLKEVQAQYGIEDNTKELDPQFADITSGNFSLPPASPVFQTGFEPIDTKHIGADIPYEIDR